MPSKKTTAESSPKPIPRRKASDVTIGDVLAKAKGIKASALVYVLLLVFVGLAMYLLGERQGMKNGSTAPTIQAQAPTDPNAPQAPTGPVDVDEGHLPVKGDEDAPVTIVEFSDFECPFCGRFYQETLPQLVSEYIDTGKVKLYYRHYPLTFHPQAKPLAVASECANEQGKFWEMHDKIFDNNATISSSTVDTYKGWAAELGLNTGQFNECLDSNKYESEVDQDMADGTAAGVSGTPTFYINGMQLVGAQPLDAFKTIIEQELAK